MGRPAEDPHKMKSWGLITAQPSEYLIHYRNGKLQEKTSGRGASCWKYPSDTVAIIPTTVKEVFFQANQITRDNVDVRIKGMAFYHIADPLLIYKRINFSFRERAEEKLAATFADMCRSYAKWLVANMTVEEAIRKRKEEIASTLRAEVERVVAGDGGWGVVIDTIDIQDVFIVSDEIFQALQQDYKSHTRLEAEQSRNEVARELEEREIENKKTLRFLRAQSEYATKEQEISYEKQASLLRIAAETEIKAQSIRAAEQLHDIEKEKELRELAIQSQYQVSVIEHQQKQDVARLIAEVERKKQEAERDRAILELRLAAEQAAKEKEIAYKKHVALLQIEADTSTKEQSIHAAEQLKELEQQKGMRELDGESQYKISVIQHKLQQDNATLAAEVERLKQGSERELLALEMKRTLETAQMELDHLRVTFNNNIAMEKARATIEQEQLQAEQNLIVLTLRTNAINLVLDIKIILP